MRAWMVALAVLVAGCTAPPGNDAADDCSDDCAPAHDRYHVADSGEGDFDRTYDWTVHEGALTTTIDAGFAGGLVSGWQVVFQGTGVGPSTSGPGCNGGLPSAMYDGRFGGVISDHLDPGDYVLSLCLESVDSRYHVDIDIQY